MRLRLPLFKVGLLALALLPHHPFVGPECRDFPRSGWTLALGPALLTNNAVGVSQ